MKWTYETRRDGLRSGVCRGAVFPFVFAFAASFPSLVMAQATSPARKPSPSLAGLPKEITPATKRAIDGGLAYLARRQERRGSWSNARGQGRYPVAMTALAGLALLMDGNTTTQGRYAPQVDRAVNFLLKSVQASGLITGGEEESRPMYGHGFAMLFLSQLYGMSEDADRARQIHRVLRDGVALIQRSQSPLGGWIYRPDSGGDEGSVTITQVQAIRSCRNVGIAVPKDVIDDAMAYLAASQNSDGGIRYSLRQAHGGSRAPITAAAVACWFNAGEYDSPLAKKAVAYCKENISAAGGGGHDFYASLYWAQALYTSSDAYWDEYFPIRRDYFLSVQSPDGSWNRGVGDIYQTSVALVVLQLPLQQLPIMQR